MRERLKRRAKSSLLDFVYYTNFQYEANWHHKVIADELTKFILSDKAERLMLFVPPQHGKSELASRALPAFALGINPDLKIAACSYSIDLARSFNRDVQRLMMTKEYHQTFPNTFLNDKKVEGDSKGSYLRNSQEFEIVGKKGNYKAVGVMGGLSGRSVDLAIIDDPIKDALEANSVAYRERLWEWYLNVLKTRLHNKSKEIIILTRWHEDDLAGRLLDKEPTKWKVIKFPAIKEKVDNHPEDFRGIGEPLWSEKHSLQKLMDLRALSETTFVSLYQQRPSPLEGDKVKRAWFEYKDIKEVPENLTKDLWIDGAYTKQTANDPTGMMVTAFDKVNNLLYIFHAHDEHLEMPELLKKTPEYCRLNGLNGKSKCHIEPKASGKSLKQMLKAKTDLNAVEIKNHLVNEGKEARLQVASPKLAAGRIILVKGNWNEKFVNQICTFPKATNDEYVDLLGYACYEYFDKEKNKVYGTGTRKRSYL